MCGINKHALQFKTKEPQIPSAHEMLGQRIKYPQITFYSIGKQKENCKLRRLELARILELSKH